MIRVKKENHRSWFMSNYYPCEFVMNGIRYKNAEAAFQSHKAPLEGNGDFRNRECLDLLDACDIVVTNF